jgi:hypothetical protein
MALGREWAQVMATETALARLPGLALVWATAPGSARVPFHPTRPPAPEPRPAKPHRPRRHKRSRPWWPAKREPRWYGGAWRKTLVHSTCSHWAVQCLCHVWRLVSQRNEAMPNAQDVSALAARLWRASVGVHSPRLLTTDPTTRRTLAKRDLHPCMPSYIAAFIIGRSSPSELP